MSIDEFWSIVGQAHAGAPSNMEEKCRLLAAELRRWPCEEIVSFGNHFSDLFFRAYSWELWAVAYMIKKGGCSDDSFMDFRATLISLGREAYEAGLRDADSLAQFDIDPAWATYEGYQYVASRVYEAKCGANLYAQRKAQGTRHPQKPTGRDWQDWDLHERYPRVAAKYGWEKRDGSAGKKAHEKFLAHMEKGRQLAQLLLDAGIIPSCGLIPPPRIVAPVLRSGCSPWESGAAKRVLVKVQKWDPFDLDEGHYWIAARNLREPSPNALANRPDLAGTKIEVDTNASAANTWAEWVESLKSRGYPIAD